MTRAEARKFIVTAGKTKIRLKNAYADCYMASNKTSHDIQIKT